MKSYKFRLYPSKEQEKKMLWTLDKCRFIYNKLLEGLGKQEKPNKNALQHLLVGLKKQYPELQNVHSKTLQCENWRLFSNLRGLGRLKKNGKKVGRLRFKSYGSMKVEDPERYKQLFHKFGSVGKTISGYRCINCGFSIISSVGGKRRQIKCPNCRRLYHGNELERIKIPRNIPKGYVKVPSSTNYQLPSDTMENLRNFYNLKEVKM